MRRPALRFVPLLAALLLPAPAHAMQLFSRNIDASLGIQGVGPYRLHLSLRPAGTSTDLVLLDILDPQAGQVYTLDGAAFAAAAACWTDGRDDSTNLLLTTTAGGAGLGPGRDSTLFFGDPSGASGVDLTGRTVESATLEIDGFFHRSPGSDMNRDGHWSDVALFATLRFHGTGDPIPLLDDPDRPVPAQPLPTPTPEPSSLVSALVGAMMVGGYALRRC